jgi:uncharacterized protein YabN with tetrapyrrole methylase and pyrophosphatase domain
MAEADITVVGLGITGVGQVTLEADRAIRRAREVLVLDAGLATHTFLAARCPRVTSLVDGTYQPGHLRLHAYHHMAARVIEAALDRAPVVMAVHGHPLVFCYPPFLVRDLARLLGLTVVVLPGVSALDALCADLWVDPGLRGVQMYEATDMLLRRRPLDPTVPAVLWQVGNVETRLHAERPSRPERFTRLVDHLLQTYPPAHEVVVYYGAPHPLVGPTADRVRLQDLAARADLLHRGVTVYVPEIGQRPIVDVDLLTRIDDPSHLAAITHDPR